VGVIEKEDVAREQEEIKKLMKAVQHVTWNGEETG
jgi:hypothetical protein